MRQGLSEELLSCIESSDLFTAALITASLLLALTPMCKFLLDYHSPYAGKCPVLAILARLSLSHMSCVSCPAMCL